MIVWGGCGPGSQHNCAINTGGRYNPASETWTPTNLVNAPGIRFYHVAVWTGSRMVVWGGCRQINDACSPNTTGSTGGVYDPATDTWTPTNQAGAPDRACCTPAYGPDRACSCGAAVTTARRKTPAPFTRRTRDVDADDHCQRAGGAARAQRGVDRQRRSWGGCPATFCFSQNQPINTGGRYDPVADAWTPTTTTNAPTVRFQHSAVWTGSEMIVWGGFLDYTGTNTGGRYNPSTDSCTPVSTTGAPTSRGGHMAVWTGTRMVIWGAASNKTGGRYDPATDAWTPTYAEDSFSFRADHTAVWTGAEMIVWGGNDAGSGNLFGRGLRYNPTLATWTPVNATGEPWGRLGHTAVWTGAEMIVWGGQYGSTPFNDGGRFNPTADTWAATTLSGAPEEKSHHTAVWTGTEMIVWGGDGNTSFQNSGGRYDPGTDSWTAVTTAAAPAGRYLHTAVWTGAEMIVWGGYGGTGDLNTGGRYDPATNAWQPMSTTGVPEARHFQTTLWTGDRMLIWGGKTGDYSSGTIYNTGGLYDPAADAWTATSLIGAPSGRFYHSGVWTDSEMIVWGGCSQPGCYTQEYTGAHYDPATNTWTGSTDVRLAPSARNLHSTVWTGDAMIVWGGQVDDTGGYTAPAANTGGPCRCLDSPAGHPALAVVSAPRLRLTQWRSAAGGANTVTTPVAARCWRSNVTGVEESVARPRRRRPRRAGVLGRQSRRLAGQLFI
jgi:N-acetylneuraminic acid mutarotase